MPPVIIVNQTSMLDDSVIAPVVLALQKQLSRDFLPIHGMSAWLKFVGKGKTVPDACWPIFMRDDTPDPSALGWHEFGNAPVGYVFVNTDLKAGTSWTNTLSHETLETVLDPHTNRCRQTTLNGKTVFFAEEACDACEDDQYGYTIDGVLVSDFMTPAYFDPQPASGKPIGNASGLYDFTGHIAKPGQLLTNGYQSYFDPAVGQWSDIQAEHSPNYQPPFPGSRRWLRQQRQALTTQ